MNRPGKCALVIASSLVSGAVLFVFGLASMDFLWTHFVVTDLNKLSIADGVVVVGGGLILGAILALLGVAMVLYRFWPEQLSQ